jgi:flagellar hook-length control protein FliK
MAPGHGDAGGHRVDAGATYTSPGLAGGGSEQGASTLRRLDAPMQNPTAAGDFAAPAANGSADKSGLAAKTAGLQGAIGNSTPFGDAAEPKRPQQTVDGAPGNDRDVFARPQRQSSSGHRTVNASAGLDTHRAGIAAAGPAGGHAAAQTGDRDNPAAVAPETTVLSQTRGLPAAALSAVSDTDALVDDPIDAQIARRIVEKAVVLRRGERSEIRMNLRPKWLGPVQLRVTAEQHHLTVRISTEMPAAKELIEQHLYLLKQDLQAQGLDVEIRDVEMQMRSGESDIGHDRGAANPAKPARSWARKKRFATPREPASPGPGDTRAENGNVDFYA